jgi:predicted hydrocarbon binding protein
MKKYKWACEVCGFLEERFDESTISNIRSTCSCSSGASVAEKMKKYLRSSDTLTEFAGKFNSENTFAQIEVVGGALYYIYPTCYCSLIKRVEQPISKSWCYCTYGYVKSLFENVFEKPVEAKLIESIKTGGTRCAVKVVLT